jgi:hypothetical protein
MKKKTSFLSLTLPTLENQISSVRDKILHSFKLKTFPIGGVTIFAEGEPVTKAIIIKKGECIMVSKRI